MSDQRGTCPSVGMEWTWVIGVGLCMGNTRTVRGQGAPPSPTRPLPALPGSVGWGRCLPSSAAASHSLLSHSFELQLRIHTVHLSSAIPVLSFPSCNPFKVQRWTALPLIPPLLIIRLLWPLPCGPLTGRPRARARAFYPLQPPFLCFGPLL